MNNSFNPNGLLPEYMDLYEKEDMHIVGDNLSDNEDYSEDYDVEEDIEEEVTKGYVAKKEPVMKVRYSSFSMRQLENGFEVTIPIQKVWNKRINVNIANSSVQVKVTPKTYSEDNESFSRRFPLPKGSTKRNTNVQTTFVKGALVVTATPK